MSASASAYSNWVAKPVQFPVDRKKAAELIELKPCVRCEQELPPTAFSHPENVFCKVCSEEVVGIIRSKYSAIEAAHFRAKLRLRSRDAMDEMRRKLS